LLHVISLGDELPPHAHSNSFKRTFVIIQIHLNEPLSFNFPTGGMK